MKYLALLIVLTLSGCMAGTIDITLPDGTKITGCYARLGDQRIAVKDGEITQQSDGSVPSGFLGLLAELFH